MKTKRLLTGILTLVLLLSCLSLPVFAEDAWEGITSTAPEGEGTETSPYLIATAGNLRWFSEQCATAHNTKWFKQTKDIDFGGAKIVPIGNADTNFRGHYDGCGFKISNFTVDGKTDAINNCGLFGRLVNATVKDIAFEGVTIITSESTSGFGGVLSGYADGSTITGITVDATSSVLGYNVGGIVGRTWNTMSNISYCINNASVSTDGVTAGEAAGGIVGLGCVVNISYCVNNGAVKVAKSTGEQMTGGIAGRFGGTTAGTISYCLNNGAISSSHTAGGIAGKNTLAGCKFENSVSTVVIAGGNKDYSGGVVGRFNATATATGCYAAVTDDYGVTGKNASEAAKGTLVSVYGETASSARLAYFASRINTAVNNYFAGKTATIDNSFVINDGVQLVATQASEVADSKYNVRFIASVDDYTKYEKIGFEVSVNDGAKTFDKVCQYVYNALSVTADNSTVYANAYDLNGNSVAAYAICNIPTSEGQITFTVKTFTAVEGGDRIYGDTYTVIYNAGAFVSSAKV